MSLRHCVVQFDLLLHDFCIFYFKENKNKFVEKDKCIDNLTLFCNQGSTVFAGVPFLKVSAYHSKLRECLEDMLGDSYTILTRSIGKVTDRLCEEHGNYHKTIKVLDYD